jgi:Na+/proline symporter
MTYFVCIIFYLLILAGIGVYKSRQVKTGDDFAVAGRSLSPWIMVCTMLAVWIGTGSIVGNAERTYKDGMAALILPLGTFIGMILLSMVAARARKIEASTVPEIIGRRFGPMARMLSVISLIIAYMVIVSYQFNAGGAVLEVITGSKDPVALTVGSQLTRDQLKKGHVLFTPDADSSGSSFLILTDGVGSGFAYGIDAARSEDMDAAQERIRAIDNRIAIRQNATARIIPAEAFLTSETYSVGGLPQYGTLELVEPILTAHRATIIAAVFIVLFTVLAGLLSLAYADIVTGSIIMVMMLVAFPIYWFKAGGWSGMEAAFAAMGDRPQHMQFWGVYSPVTIINFCLPVFLLVLGDANQYQRIFASRNAKGAKSAVTTMIFVALVIELLIIACAWIAASMTPDPVHGKYILIYAAKHYLPLPLGCLFMVTVVGIIISTADSFLLVPSTTFIKDVYLNYINPQASEKRVLLLSRIMVVVFGVIAYLVSLAFAESTGFFEKALYAFTIYGASITPSLVAAIVWPRATKMGSIASILSGTIIALVWAEAGFIQGLLPQAVADLIQRMVPAAASELDAVLPAITVSVFCLIVVSLLTSNKETSEK